MFSEAIRELYVRGGVVKDALLASIGLVYVLVCAVRGRGLDVALDGTMRVARRR